MFTLAEWCDEIAQKVTAALTVAGLTDVKSRVGWPNVAGAIDGCGVWVLVEPDSIFATVDPWPTQADDTRTRNRPCKSSDAATIDVSVLICRPQRNDSGTLPGAAVLDDAADRTALTATTLFAALHDAATDWRPSQGRTAIAPVRAIPQAGRYSGWQTTITVPLGCLT